MCADRPATLPIATLGPPGTDAEHVARRLSPVVVLHGTFRSALQQAHAEDCIALVACGCMSESETWVDLHFEFSDVLDVVFSATVPTKPMCLATRRGAPASVRTVGVYPAIRSLAKRYVPDAAIVGFKSKPAAVQACVDGRVDACIGSLDVVRQRAQLSVAEVIEATMVWTLYARKDLGSLRTRLATWT